MIDTEVTELRNNLKEHKLLNIMWPPSLYQYNVKWKPGGVNPDKNVEHSRYIDSICTHFVEGVKRQVKHTHNHNWVNSLLICTFYDVAMHKHSDI